MIEVGLANLLQYYTLYIIETEPAQRHAPPLSSQQLDHTGSLEESQVHTSAFQKMST